VLKDLHDELDTAVLQAYGWDDLSGTLRQAQGQREGTWGKEANDALLTRLVALNAQRAAEEKAGRIRWLRPEFQNPAAGKTLQNQELLAPAQQGLQSEMALENKAKPVSSKTSAKTTQPWPANLPEQVRALAQVLASHSGVLTVAEIEACFKGRGPWKKSLPRILETLEALGRARREEAGGTETWRA
jgi:hypothetical protein